MVPLKAIILGLIQGLTEFLPISSSGHLVIFQNLLGLSEPQLLLDVTLHMGTLLAVLIYFRKDISVIINQALDLFKLSAGRIQGQSGQEPRLLLWIIVGCVPTGLIGIVFKDPFEKMFGSVSTVSIMLLVTGCIIASTHFLPQRYTSRKHIGLVSALLVGTAQGLSIIPGISRSGMTIAFGLFCGLDRELAGKFSFLISVPAIIGAMLLQLHENSITSMPLMPLALGFFTSASVGLFCLKVLMQVVKKGRLAYFAPYCFFAGTMAIIFL